MVSTYTWNIERVNQKTMLNAFAQYSRAMIYTKDIDPLFPLLKHYHISKRTPLQSTQAIWRSLLLVAYYKMASAEAMWNLYPYPRPLRKLTVTSTGVERRGMRVTGKLIEHLNSVIGLGDFQTWVERCLVDDPKKSWSNVRTEFEKVRHVGTWASYKFCELLRHVHDYPISAPDIGASGGGKTSGSIAGLVWVSKASWQDCLNDFSVQDRVYKQCLDLGVPFSGMDEFETTLCGFNGMCKGNCYIGSDIDDYQPFCTNSPDPIWMTLRRVIFRAANLGELNGWYGSDGSRKKLKTLFRDRGILHVD